MNERRPARKIREKKRFIKRRVYGGKNIHLINRYVLMQKLNETWSAEIKTFPYLAGEILIEPQTNQLHRPEGKRKKPKIGYSSSVLFSFVQSMCRVDNGYVQLRKLFTLFTKRKCKKKKIEFRGQEK